MRLHLKQIGIILSLFLVALLPRVVGLDLIEYKADEALTVHELRRFFKEPFLFQTGLVSSVGARNFPLFHYMLLVPSTISRDPRLLSGVIGFLNACMVVVFYLGVKKYYTPTVAVFSSFLYATAPWLILLSRKIWAQDLIPLLAVPLFILTHSLHCRPTFYTSFWFGICLILLIQLHASGIFIGLILLGFIISHRVVHSRALIVGIVIGLLPALPYLHLQFASRPMCPDCRAYWNQNSLSQKSFDWSHGSRPLFVFTGLAWDEVTGHTDYLQLQQQFPFTTIALGGFIAIALSGIWGSWVVVKASPHRWVLIPVLGTICLYFILQVPSHLHYYQVLVPWLLLIIGLGLAQLPSIQQPIVITAFGFIITLNLLFIISFFIYLHRHHQVAGDYGAIFRLSNAWVTQSLASFSNRPDFDSLRLIAELHTPQSVQLGPASVELRLANYLYQNQEATTAAAIVDRLTASYAAESAIHQLATSVKSHYNPL